MIANRGSFLHVMAELLFAGEVGFDAPVLCSAFLGFVAGNRLGESVAFGRDAVRGDAEVFDEIVADAVGTPLGELEIARLAAYVVGVPVNGTLGIGEFNQEVADLFEFVMELGLYIRLVGVEVDVNDCGCAKIDRGCLGLYRLYDWRRRHNNRDVGIA